MVFLKELVCMHVCIYHQEQSTHGVAITTQSLNQVFACRSGDQSYNNTAYSQRALHEKSYDFSHLLNLLIYTSKTPFGQRTSERESEPCTCRRVRGYFQLACEWHPTSRSLAVCQIWRQSTRPFLRSGSDTLHAHTEIFLLY